MDDAAAGGPPATGARRFFDADGRLLDLPPPWHPARAWVLARVADRFAPDVDHAWRAVDDVLREVARDHASLRRALVDDGLLTRADGVYRRVHRRT